MDSPSTAGHQHAAVPKVATTDRPGSQGSRHGRRLLATERRRDCNEFLLALRFERFGQLRDLFVDLRVSWFPSFFSFAAGFEETRSIHSQNSFAPSFKMASRRLVYLNISEVQRLQRQLGLTDEKLAFRAGISVVTLNRWMNEKKERVRFSPRSRSWPML